MPKANNSAKEQLLTLEKLVNKVIRKSLKNNTLDYTVQITTSSLEPGEVKYAAMITSPAGGVQPITFVFDTYALLEGSLVEAAKELNPKKVEIAFHENRINSYKNKIVQHEERVANLKDPDFTDEIEDDEDIEMEQV